MTSSPRLRPLPVAEWSDDAANALREAFPEGVIDRIRIAGAAPNVLATMLHHPRLAAPFTTYGNVLLREPAVGHRNRELMLLRVAWRTGARYEWVHHVRLAPQYGLTAEDVDAIIDGTTCPRWTGPECDLVAATDEMLDFYRISPETWQRLSGSFTEEQLVEIPFIVGTYTCLAMAFNSWDLQVEDGVGDSDVPLPPRD
ncbi:alkylhydroperoxidase family enzyme [Mycobacterium sp. BK558]|nr:alkylhydroperoxidase family enzyme [Mycobacterium sp. BK558]